MKDWMSKRYQKVKYKHMNKIIIKFESNHLNFLILYFYNAIDTIVDSFWANKLITSECYNNLIKLHNFINVFLLWTVECKRNFSITNLIKIDLRNRILDNTSDSLMTVTLADLSSFISH